MHSYLSMQDEDLDRPSLEFVMESDPRGSYSSWWVGQDTWYTEPASQSELSLTRRTSHSLEKTIILLTAIHVRRINTY